MRVTKKLSIILAGATLSLTAAAAPPPFRVPEGFTVTKFAGDDLCHDAWAMTIAPDGRVAVSGPGYIKILLDSDQDGVADKAHPVPGKHRNAHGLLFLGPDLLSVQPQGIFRHRDRTRDGLPESNPELFYKLPGGGGEHGPHGIRQGPDGWFYLACGNNTKIGKKYVTTASSPIVNPSQGTVLRISPDGKQSEVIAHGFRNHYDLAFNKDGHLFTFDSDGERDHQLPWYSYCRVFHVRVGGHHGWLLPGHQRSFNRPPYFFDSVDRLIEIDRGSPTGVEVYRHTQFPEPYRDGLFFACWTYGRVYFTQLVRSGESYRRLQPDTFLETTGNLGFAPSDIAVHPPSGDLFVSVGGRGTRGSIYRVSYPKGKKNGKALPLYETPKNWSIHDQKIAPVAPLAPADALALFKKESSAQSRLTAIRHLMLTLGDISTNEAKRRIDAGYTANKPDALPANLRAAVIKDVTAAMRTGSGRDNRNLHYELARLLAMLHADDAASVEQAASPLGSVSTPAEDAHYLFCLAQMPGPREAVSRERIAGAFLSIDRKLAQGKLLTDRNWTINLRDALKAHLLLDPKLGEHMQAHALFGQPSQAYLLRLLPQSAQEKAAKTMIRTNHHWNSDALSFVRPLLSPEELLSLYRSQWINPALRPVLAGPLSRQGTAADKILVEKFYQPPSARIDLTPFHEKMKKVDWSKGDAKRGQTAYARLTCTACHSGNTRLGPDLKNIAKRFSREDLFRHINEPNLAISDLYKATQITTKDGTYVGVKVYSSQAQTILETGAGETIRFSRHDILSERQPNQSPMPPGLLLGSSPAELADLYAYMKTL